MKDASSSSGCASHATAGVLPHSCVNPAILPVLKAAPAHPIPDFALHSESLAASSAHPQGPGFPDTAAS